MPEERIAELRRELAENPASRQFYQLGELLRRQGQLAEAAEVLRQGLVHHPRYVAAWVSLGRALLDLQQLDQAREAFRRALDLDPHNPVAWRLSGEALLALGMRREALGAFEQALALVPGDEVLSEAVATLREELAAVEQHPKLAPAPAPDAFGQVAEEEPFATLPPPPVVEEVFPLEAALPQLAEQTPVFGEPFPLPPPPPPVELAFPALEPTPELAPEALFGGKPLLPREPEQPPVLGEPEPLLAVPEPAATPELEAPPRGEVSAAPEAPPPVRAPEPASPQAREAAEEIPTAPHPPASLAAAREAVHRGDLPQAVVILEQLLAVERENQEAADLLALVRDMMEPLPPEEPKLSPRERKIAALQRFLANVTLARERMGL